MKEVPESDEPDSIIKRGPLCLSSAAVSLPELREPRHRIVLSTPGTLQPCAKLSSNVRGLRKNMDNLPKQNLKGKRRLAVSYTGLSWTVDDPHEDPS